MVTSHTPLDGRSVVVAGVRVEPFTLSSLIERVLQMARSDGVDVAVGINAHVCNQARSDAGSSRFVVMGSVASLA